MKKKPLRVRLDVREPSIIDLTVGDRVQLDRLTSSEGGHLAARHGDLLAPGVTRLALPPGRYFFKTLQDAHLRVVTGGVDGGVVVNDKDPWPDPPGRLDGDPPPSPAELGDEPAGAPPRLRIEPSASGGVA